MRTIAISLLLAGLILIGALIATSHDPREQTIFLERIAAELQRAKTIPPETDRRMRELIASIRRDQPRVNERLKSRQKIAIERIEAILSDHTATSSIRATDQPADNRLDGQDAP